MIKRNIRELSLEEAWEKCLEMWKWISEVIAKSPIRLVVIEMKHIWLLEHDPEMDNMASGCYFCEFRLQNSTNGYSCDGCPAKLIDPEFHCMAVLEYNHEHEPVKFYQKLVELNELRKKHNP